MELRCSGRGIAARLRAIRNHRIARWLQNVARRKFGTNVVKERRFRLWAQEHEDVFRAALLLQRVARGMMGRIKARKTIVRRKHAIDIQRVWKGYLARRNYLQLFAIRFVAVAVSVWSLLAEVWAFVCSVFCSLAAHWQHSSMDAGLCGPMDG